MMRVNVLSIHFLLFSETITLPSKVASKCQLEVSEASNLVHVFSATGISFDQLLQVNYVLVSH